MSKFRLLIEGANFPARAMVGATAPLGFYATRFVEARSIEDAEVTAMQMLRNEFRQFFGLHLPDKDTPTLLLIESEELSEFPAGFVNGGASWFEMNS